MDVALNFYDYKALHASLFYKAYINSTCCALMMAGPILTLLITQNLLYTVVSITWTLLDLALSIQMHCVVPAIVGSAQGQTNPFVTAIYLSTVRL